MDADVDTVTESPKNSCKPTDEAEPSPISTNSKRGLRSFVWKHWSKNEVKKYFDSKYCTSSYGVARTSGTANMIRHLYDKHRGKMGSVKSKPIAHCFLPRVDGFEALAACLGAGKVKRIDDLVNRLVVSSTQFSLVMIRISRKLTNRLNPVYKLCLRKTLKQSIIDDYEP